MTATTQAPQATLPAYSIVIPLYNEEEALPPLVARVLPVAEALGRCEILFVDDGSTDRSHQVLQDQRKAHPASDLKIVTLRRNFGKSFALAAGFAQARGAILIMMDADLQDQPEEIPKLLAHLESHHLDALTGWKKERQDGVDKTLPSRLFNWYLRRRFNLPIHDFNCGLKVMRAECVRNLILYGQMHRFMLVLMAYQGFRVGELPVNHAPRTTGHSKYGAKRLLHGLLDALSVNLIVNYLYSPLYFFGKYALMLFAGSLVIFVYYISLHFYSYLHQQPKGMLDAHPLWIISPMLFLAGLVFLFFGLLGQLTIHLHLHAKADNLIRQTTGFDDPPPPASPPPQTPPDPHG